jgi:hypothetical protein
VLTQAESTPLPGVCTPSTVEVYIHPDAWRASTPNRTNNGTLLGYVRSIAEAIDTDDDALLDLVEDLMRTETGSTLDALSGTDFERLARQSMTDILAWDIPAPWTASPSPATARSWGSPTPRRAPPSARPSRSISDRWWRTSPRPRTAPSASTLNFGTPRERELRSGARPSPLLCTTRWSATSPSLRARSSSDIPERQLRTVRAEPGAHHHDRSLAARVGKQRVAHRSRPAASAEVTAIVLLPTATPPVAPRPSSCCRVQFNVSSSAR